MPVDTLSVISELITQPTVSQHWRAMVSQPGHWGQGPIALDSAQ